MWCILYYHIYIYIGCIIIECNRYTVCNRFATLGTIKAWLALILVEYRSMRYSFLFKFCFFSKLVNVSSLFLLDEWCIISPLFTVLHRRIRTSPRLLTKAARAARAARGPRMDPGMWCEVQDPVETALEPRDSWHFGISRLSWDITWDIYWDLHSYNSYSSYGNVARSEIIEVIVGLSIAIYLMTILQEGHPESVIISDPMAKGWSHVELWLSPRSSKMQETYIFFL